MSVDAVSSEWFRVCFGSFFWGRGGEKFLGQLFHYLPFALSGPGSQLWPRLAGTTIIITISHQTAPASA